MQILAVRGTLPEHTHTQDEITAAFADVIAQGRLDERVLRRFHRNAGVSQRHLALPLAAYGELGGFTEANDHFITEAVALGSRAVEEALKAALQIPGVVGPGFDELPEAAVEQVRTVLPRCGVDPEPVPIADLVALGLLD